MEFGVQFFPSVGPHQRPAAEYFHDCLALCEAADGLGYTHARTVEHYFTRYGGYSPNPVVFLSAAAARTHKLRIVTGAILPVFNHPLKVAGEIGMLDAISNGRLDVGLARAFLPHEFRRFHISPDESIARFREGLEQIDLLLREENVTHHGTFHDIVETTSLPRPTQKPRPKFYVAATINEESFAYAGKMGFSVMAIPMAGPVMRTVLGAYRNAWREAGHPGKGEIMLAFHMFVDRDGDRARRIAKPRVESYLKAIVEASSDWATGTSSKDYAGYDKMVHKLSAETFESQVESGSAWVGTPEEVRAIISRCQEEFGGFEHASMQVNFFDLGLDDAMGSLKLFAHEVISHFVPAAVK
ncbi:MAG TPA: LLM class flavin-dependent oxidoreductase [Candidatus Binatia bacterium]|nr:LLM class flavin-dependent oxidoreductase [Candidatus Binatia bacterium]